MLKYWFEVLHRSIIASFDAIGQTKGTIAFSVLAIVIGAGIVWYLRGTEAMKADLLRTVLEVVAVMALAWLPFFLWHFAGRRI